MSEHISNERLETILRDGSTLLNELLQDRADDMQRAWNENIEEAHHADKEGIPPLKITASLTVDLELNEVSAQIGFTAKYQSKAAIKLPDPNQPELPIDGEEAA